MVRIIWGFFFVCFSGGAVLEGTREDGSGCDFYLFLKIHNCIKANGYGSLFSVSGICCPY